MWRFVARAPAALPDRRLGLGLLRLHVDPDGNAEAKGEEDTEGHPAASENSGDRNRETKPDGQEREAKRVGFGAKRVPHAGLLPLAGSEGSRRAQIT